MLARRTLVLPTLVLALGFVQGCATLESERDPDWQSAVKVEPLADTGAENDGSRLVIGNPRTFAVIDGASGEPVGVLGDGGGLPITISVGETAAYRLRPASSNVVTLGEAGIALVLDYEGTNERITAISLADGDKAWHRTDYRYSVQQYEETIRRVASAVGETVAAVLGGEASGEAVDDQRRRQRHFAQHLAAPVDDGDALLFKTFGSLVKLDARSGVERWRVERFNGPGILQVETLDNGDYLVLSSPRNLSRLQAASSYDLARVGADGRVRWISEHAGNATRGMQVAANRVVVDGTPLQVFDLDDGGLLWENELRYAAEDFPDPRHMPPPAPLITDHALYQAAFTHGEDGEFISTGFPHRVRAHDLDSGNELWATEQTSTFYGELHEIDDQLIVWGAGEFFGDHDGGGIAALDRDTGEVRWRTPAMATPGTFSLARWVVEPVFDGDREHIYIAGPQDLYGMRISDGRQVLGVELDAAGIGSTVGLVQHDGRIVVVGRNGVAAYDRTDGAMGFAIETEQVADFSVHGDRLVLHLTAAVAGIPEDDNGAGGGVVAIDLERGSAGPMVAWAKSAPLVFGPLGGSRAFVTDDGRHAYIVDGDGYLTRYTL